MQRRNFTQLVAGLCSSGIVSPILANAPNYPNKTIKIIVGSTPGALTDVATRLYAEKVAKILEQTVVVENISGASSIIATKNLLKADADGYTLLTVANTAFTLPYLSPKANYSPSRDFTPIAELSRGPAILVVSGNSPYRTLQDLVRMARKKPNAVTYASGGVGTTSHLPMEMLQREAKMELLHVPYKGIAPAVVDLIGGRIDAMMGTPTSMLAPLRSGQLRALAITAEERLEEFPSIPTFKEEGFENLSYSIFIALVGPAGMPDDVRKKIAKAFDAAKRDKSVTKQLSQLGQSLDPRMSDLRQFEKFLFEDEAKYARLIQENGIKID